MSSFTRQKVKEKNGYYEDSTISLILKTGYDKLVHVNRINDTAFLAGDRRDLFTAEINNQHPNKELHGKKVYLKKIGLTQKNEKQCWREIMIGLEMKHSLIGQIVDNWIEINEGRPANAYYATLDKGGHSLKQLLRTEGKLKRQSKSPAPIHFKQFVKIAQDLFTTLIILKKNAVLHRDIIINNVLIHDLEGKEVNHPNGPGPRTELIDFGWAKKIVNATATINVGTAGKIAPELSLKTKEYDSLITRDAYSYPVDVYATAQVLLECIEIDKGFLKIFKKILGFKETGNILIDESFASTMFALFAEKEVNGEKTFSPMATPDQEHLEAMIRVNPGCQMPDPETYKEKLRRFLNVNGKRGEQVETDSLAQKYMRNFWFRYLDEDKGWTAKRIDLTVDLLMKMLNYWPEDRPTCEELYKHPIFNEMEGEGDDAKLVLPTRTDFKDVEVMVKHSGDNNFRAFQGRLAQASSSLLMKTKREAVKGDIDSDSNISIHTILNLQERIEVKSNNVNKKPIQLTSAQALENYRPKWEATEHGSSDDNPASKDNFGNMNNDDLYNYMDQSDRQYSEGGGYTAISKLEQGEEWNNSTQKGEKIREFNNDNEKHWQEDVPHHQSDFMMSWDDYE